MKIAVVGSSGGNLHSQGGDDPRSLLEEIKIQADAAGIELAFVQFIWAAKSMDGIAQDTDATFVSMTDSKELSFSTTQQLSAINTLAKKSDVALSQLIQAGKIDGLLLMSCDPTGVNQQAIQAAVDKQLPIAGTGGTSMATVASLGAKIIAQSGTTGTTNRTRAVSAISVFAKEWQLRYSPVIGSRSDSATDNVFKRISIRGIMMAAMPGFIAMALSLALSKIPGLTDLSSVFDTLIGLLPIMIAAIAAKQISGMDEVGLIAGIAAGALSAEGGIIGGLIVGIVAGLLVYYISSFCFKNGIPATTTTIAAGGLSGLFAGLLGKYLLAPAALALGNLIKEMIDWALNFNPVFAGAIAGAAIWFAIIGGVYHAAILPIVLLEMEATGFSFLGAIDLVCLVAVCAGIQLAYIIQPRNPGDRTTAMTNIFINLAFGTFVEAAYPFMFSSRKVFGAAILAATLAGTLVGLLNVKSTAYVPTFVAPFMSNDKILSTIICLVAAVMLACSFTLLASRNLMKTKG